MALDIEHMRDYIVQQARVQFPDAFDIVANPAFYTFRPQTLDNGQDAGMVYIGLYDHHQNTKGRKPLWACIDGSEIFYYFDSSAEFLKVKDGALTLYPNSGTTRHRDAEAPFSLVNPQTWPSNHKEKTAARKLTRNTLESLIKFAFMLTERGYRLPRQNPDLLLEELEQLCGNLQRNQYARNKAALKREKDQDEEEEEEDIGSANSLQMHLPLARKQAWTMPNYTRTKRPGEDVEGMSADHGVRKMHDRMVDTSLLPPRSHGDKRSSTPQSAPLSVDHREMIENLVENILAQREEGWSKEKAALQEQVETLQAEVAYEQKKYQLLTESLEDFARNAVQRRCESAVHCTSMKTARRP